MQTNRILICDDDELSFKAIKSALPKHQVTWSPHCDAALESLRKGPADLLILDINIRNKNEGLTYLPKFLEQYPDLVVLMLSGQSDYASVRTALTAGAFDFLSKEATQPEILIAIEKALRHKSLVAQNHQLQNEVRVSHQKNQFVGKSPAIQELRKKIEKLRYSDVNVLIEGEPGTGKEIVARQLRGVGPHGALLPFVSIDSSVINASTAESTLFGHEKGAFTGADKPKRGLFEEANGGTIYFDELANMSLDIQAKLLRVIQEKEILRLGANQPVPLTFRVVAATNKNLNKQCDEGQFRQDLLDRIAVVTLTLPPLRERKEDIPLLIEHLLLVHSKRPIKLLPETIETLQNYSWPGNIRELSNVVAYFSTLADGEEIAVTDLPSKLWDLESKKSPAGNSFYDQVKAFEKGLLKAEYEKANGKVTDLAKRLKMDRSYLHQKLKQFGIHE